MADCAPHGLKAGCLSLWEAMEQAGAVEGISTRAAKSAQQFVAIVGRWREISASGGNVRQDDVDVVRVRKLVAGLEAKRRADRHVIEQPAVLDADAGRGQIRELQERAAGDGDVRRCGDVHPAGLRTTLENTLPPFRGHHAGIGNQPARADHFAARL